MHTCVGAQGLCFSTCLSLCHGLGFAEKTSLKDTQSSIPVGLILASVCGLILGRYSLGFFQLIHYLRPWRTRKSGTTDGSSGIGVETSTDLEEEEMFEEFRTPSLLTHSNFSNSERVKEIDVIDKVELAAALMMHHGMQRPSPRRAKSGSSNSGSEGSLKSNAGYPGREHSPKRPIDFDAQVGMTVASKRLSPGNSSLFSMSSCSSIGSDLGAPSMTCSSCGSPCGPFGPNSLSEADVDFMASDTDDSRVEQSIIRPGMRAKSPVSFGDETECAENGLRGIVPSLLDHSRYARSHRDGIGLSFLDGQMSAAAWMCGRDAASLKLECGLGWLDLVRPCLDDVYGEQWEQKAHPEDLERCKAIFAEAKAKRGPFQVDYRLQVSPEEYRWVMDLAKPRFSLVNHEFLGYVGWRIDIHEQKSIEVDMEKYWSLPHEILVKAAPDGKYFKNVSPSFTDRLGYTQEEFLSTEWMELLHPDDRVYTMDEFKKVALGQPIVNLQNRYRCKAGAKVDGPTFVDSTGTYKWFNWTANYMYGAGRDISGEKVAQEELRRSQAELRRITDAIPGGVFQYRIDEKGVETFPFVSKGALSMCSSQEAVLDEAPETAHYEFSSNQPHKESGLAVHADDLPTLREAMRQSSLAHTNLDCDYRIVKNSEVRWVRVHAVPQTRGNDGTKEWCGITWDITERHLAEEALRKARDVAEKSSEAKGKFLANMSHEIRTPMNAVIGMGALLLETELNDEQREYVSTIRSSGEALLAVINDILDFSKIEAGKMDLEVAPFSLTDCIEDSLDLISSQAASKGLELTYTVAEKVPSMLKGDVSRVRQILVNLLSNAMKFTEHGHVSIAVDGRKLDELPSLRCLEEMPTRLCAGTTPLTEEGSKWEIQISVKDTGIGIPDDRKHTLFQAFRQVDASTTRKYGGTGLGLAICARLCALWGGRIWVDSVSGQGSTFHFTINGEEIVQVDKSDDEEDYVTFLRKKRVLVIAGSSSSSQTMCTRFLKSWQVRVVSAVTADEALQVVRQTLDHAKDGHSCSCKHTETSSLNDPFMAVVVDCAMIDKDNRRVLESLKLCQSSNPRIPVIPLTPFARRIQDYVQELDFRCAAHVSKPVKASHLLSSLMNAIMDDKDDMAIERVDPEPNKELSTPGLKKWTKRLNAGAPVSMDVDTGKRYPLRILVAEDNAINQKVLLRLLQRHGYTADVVGNGLEAVDAASRQSYDVCLMDCFMPEMDGLEATKRIRQRINPCPVIVAVTAAALEGEKRACQQAGMHMYIAKPIKAEQLIRTLYKCWQVKTREINVESLQQEILSAPSGQRKY
ncbi:protein MpPAS3 [Marchantia polymorpha subsp. ruderalis]